MSQHSKILYQGAEAIVSLEDNKVKKERIAKNYRISFLDEKLRKLRTRSEAKIIEKLKNIINVPQIIKVDKNDIIMEYIPGKKLSDNLDNFSPDEQIKIMRKIGEITAKMHDFDIIHGDLTTSNMILVEKYGNKKESNENKKNADDAKDILENCSKKLLTINKNNLYQNADYYGNEKETNDSNLTSSINNKRLLIINNKNITSNFKIYLIDFGLGFHSAKTEDKAVDIHLLKQALKAKHFKNWHKLFQEFLKGYEKSQNYKETLKRLEKVELRGRYRH